MRVSVPYLHGLISNTDGTFEVDRDCSFRIYTNSDKVKRYEYHDNQVHSDGVLSLLVVYTWYRNFDPDTMRIKIEGGKKVWPTRDIIEIWDINTNRYQKKQIFWKEEESGIRYLDRRLSAPRYDFGY